MKTYKYRKITDEHTTYALVEPDYNLLNTLNRITELGTVDGFTFISVPDDLILRHNPADMLLEQDPWPP